MRKTFLFIFAAVCALCVSLSLTFAINTSVVRAETVSGVTPTLSSTKYLKSTDGTTMLLATGIKDFTDCYECGYVTSGTDAVKRDVKKYYESITLKKDEKEKTWRAEDLFPGYDGMIVWEVKNVSTETSFKPYVNVGDREDGVLVESDNIVYGTEKTLESVVGVSSSLTGVLLPSGLDEFATSEKALSFEYKTTDESAGTDTVTFTLWTADGLHRLTNIFTLNVESNTLSGSAGEIKDIGDGWRRVFINCSDMPICTAEGADGTETIGTLFFNEVNRAIVVANAEFVDEDFHFSAKTFTAGTLQNSYFGDTPETSGVELDQVVIFDVKFATSGSLSFYLNEYWNSKYCGPFTLTSAGVLSGNGANSCESIGDGWYRIRINLNKASKSPTAPAFVSNFYIQPATTASGFVVYVGNEDPDIHEDAKTFTASTQKDYYFVENYATSGVELDKIMKIDVKFESAGSFSFYLNESSDGKYCGLYALTSAGVLSGSGAVSAESIDDGWYRIYIDLGKAAKTNDPSFISRINIAATTSASGYVMYMGYEVPDIHEDAVAFTASTQKDYYFVKNYTTTGVALDKIMKIDVKFESAGSFSFYLNESSDGKYCGLYALTSAGVLSGSGAVSAESIDDGWYRIYIDLGKAAKTNDPSFISRINIAATTSASGYVMYMGYDEPEIVEPVIFEPKSGDSLDLPETITSYTWSDKYLTFKLKPVDPASTGTIQMKLASDSADLSYGIRLVFNSNSAPTNGRAIASVGEKDDDGWYLITTQTCKEITGSAGNVTKLTFAQYSSGGYPSFYLKDLEVH